MNPYAYVGGNPETFVDPTGQMVDPNDPSGEPKGETFPDIVLSDNGYGGPAADGGDEIITASNGLQIEITPTGDEVVVNPPLINYDENWSEVQQEEQQFDEQVQQAETEVNTELGTSEETKLQDAENKFRHEEAQQQSNGSSQSDTTNGNGIQGNGNNGEQGPGAYQQGNQGPSNYAPKQVNPGIQNVQGVHVNNLGRVEPHDAQYDQYGRQIARTDYNAENPAADVPAVHHHLYLYNEEYPGGIGLPPDLDHIPGEYNPNSWAWFWLL